MNNIALGILDVLNRYGEIHGTKDLSSLVMADHKDVRRNAVALAAHGLIKLETGSRGRGHKTIYRDAGALKHIDHQEQAS